MIEKILVSLICVWLGMEKMSLYKFTHGPLYKNDTQLKKSGKQPTQKKKRQYPNLLKKINHAQKKKKKIKSS